MQEIVELIQWGGGWASRFFYDNAVGRHLNHEKQDFYIADLVARNAIGYSAEKVFKNFEKLTGYKIDSTLETGTLNASPLFDISARLGTCRRDIFTSCYWYERLKFELNSVDLTDRIGNMLHSECKPPRSNPTSYLYNWSFPIISELMPLKDNRRSVVFIESELALICWKRWYLSKSLSPMWLESANKSNISSSRFLVMRLLHEATHLLHLQNFPTAGQMTDPHWILQMESIAMSAEYRFLEYLEIEKTISGPKDYFFNVFNIKIVLLLGFFERALRLEYELDIYSMMINPNEWVKEMKFKYNFHLDIFDFAYEFHNMPGFMSGYLIGMDAYNNLPDEISYLKGTKLIF